MRKILFCFFMIMSSSISNAQSYDEQLVAAMNSGDWFALDSIYNATPKDSISDFIEVYSRCLIGNRLNRPDVSIPAFTELFNEQSSQLDLNNILNSAMMFAMDLSRVGDNVTAGAVLNSVLNSTKQYQDSVTISAFQRQINQYTALTHYKPYTIQFEAENGVIPFTIASVGKDGHESVLMRLNESYINGIKTDITFDTGAAVNVISDSLALKLNLISLDDSGNVAGIGLASGKLAMAKEFKIGNITIMDVPFLVMNITSNNEEADQFMDCFNIVVGSELMLRLKDLTLDFVDRRIYIPATPPFKTDIPSNICFSSQMNLLTKGVIHNNPMLMCIDSGDTSFGSLGSKFYDQNKEYISSNFKTETIRTAGIGGVHLSECYKVSGLKLTLGNNSVIIPHINVLLQDSPNGYDCNLGLKTLMLFDKIRFNLVDFVLTAEPSQRDLIECSN